jgi:hypothetical protein
MLRRRGGYHFARIPVRIEKAEACAALEIGVHEIGEQSCLAGASLTDDIDMSAAVGLQQRHSLS